MTEPTPYNFGGEPDRPIRNKHLKIETPKKMQAWNKGLKDYKGKPTPVMKKFGLHLMDKGEVKLLIYKNADKIAKDYNAVAQVMYRSECAITVQRVGLELTIRCHKKLNRPE